MSALYVPNGFVEHLKKKHFFWKVFLTPFVDLERKKLGFCWTFSGVGSKSAINVDKKTIWVRRRLFPKLLFDNFHTIIFFETTFVVFVVFWDLERKTFGFLAKFKDRGFQICTKYVQNILNKENLFWEIFFSNFSKPVKNLDLFVKNFLVGLSKLSSSTVRGNFWSRIAFSLKNHHFHTLSKTLSTFCQNHFGTIVITAIYITSGAFIWKELLSKNLRFFIILHPWEGILWTSVVQISAWISKLHFSLLKG